MPRSATHLRVVAFGACIALGLPAHAEPPGGGLPRPPERPPEFSPPAAAPPDMSKAPSKDTSKASSKDTSKASSKDTSKAPSKDTKATYPEPPRPPGRPQDPSTAPSAEAAKPSAAEMPPPPPRPAELSGEAALPVVVAAPDDTACRRRLERLGASFEPLPALSNGQCGAARPLRVAKVSSEVALTPPATLVCAAAEALARWATEVEVAADRTLGHRLSSLAIGTSYECRGQNHDMDAKLSEHAFANGVDVMGFGFAGRAPVAIGPLPEGTPEARFQADVRARACGLFRTVLGPGSDASHANHFHLDERERSAGHRICQ